MWCVVTVRGVRFFFIVNHSHRINKVSQRQIFKTIISTFCFSWFNKEERLIAPETRCANTPGRSEVFVSNRIKAGIAHERVQCSSMGHLVFFLLILEDFKLPCAKKVHCALMCCSVFFLSVAQMDWFRMGKMWDWTDFASFYFGVLLMLTVVRGRKIMGIKREA